MYSLIKLSTETIQPKNLMYKLNYGGCKNVKRNDETKI